MTKLEKFAELVISMSTDFLLGKISEEHYKDTLELVIKQVKNSSLATVSQLRTAKTSVIN